MKKALFAYFVFSFIADPSYADQLLSEVEELKDRISDIEAETFAPETETDRVNSLFNHAYLYMQDDIKNVVKTLNDISVNTGKIGVRIDNIEKDIAKQEADGVLFVSEQQKQGERLAIVEERSMNNRWLLGLIPALVFGLVGVKMRQKFYKKGRKAKGKKND